MDYRYMTAPCGLDCFNCVMYLAQENEQLRKTIAGAMGIPSEQAACRGCRGEGGKPVFLNMTEPCHAYKCTKKRSIDFCYECPDFPCDHLQPYADMASQYPHNMKVYNLCLIKKMGLESWAKTKAKSIRDTYYTGKFKL